MPERAPIFAIGDRAQADALLQGDGIADGSVFDLSQLRARKRAVAMSGARLEQLRWAQHRAHVIGAKRGAVEHAIQAESADAGSME